LHATPSPSLFFGRAWDCNTFCRVGHFCLLRRLESANLQVTNPLTHATVSAPPTEPPPAKSFSYRSPLPRAPPARPPPPPPFPRLPLSSPPLCPPLSSALRFFFVVVFCSEVPQEPPWSTTLVPLAAQPPPFGLSWPSGEGSQF